MPAKTRNQIISSYLFGFEDSEHHLSKDNVSAIQVKCL